MAAARRLIGALGLTGVTAALCPVAAGAQTLPDCWRLTFGAIAHRAAAPHPQFITYNETLEIQRDGQPFMRSRATIAYRDDGVVRIADERFNERPYVATFSEPGPPELGPYAGRRSQWLPETAGTYENLPLIGDVRTRPAGMTCATLSRERYHDHDVYRIAFRSARADHPALEGLWIDAESQEIWKVQLSGYVPIAPPGGGASTSPRLTDFEVELQHSGPYLVVDHVTWKFSEREYSQTSQFFGEYYYSGFAFPAVLPAAYFRT